MQLRAVWSHCDNEKMQFDRAMSVVAMSTAVCICQGRIVSAATD